MDPKTQALRFDEAELAAVESERGEVFAERAGVDGIAEILEVFDRFSRDQEDSLPGTTVDLRMGAGVSFKTEGSNVGFRDRALRNSATRDVYLDDLSHR